MLWAKTLTSARSVRLQVKQWLSVTLHIMILQLLDGCSKKQGALPTRFYSQLEDAEVVEKLLVS